MIADRELKDALKSYLNARHSMTLATCAGSRPWAAAVYFAYDDHFNFYFLSDRKSRHSADIKLNGAIAAAINEDQEDWRRIKGVQMEGQATRVSSPVEIAKALGLYLRKFPFVRDFMASPLKSGSAMSIGGKLVAFDVYRLTPRNLFFLDNQTGFSHREELILEARS